MRRLKIILPFVAVMSVLAGCIGDKGNTLESYDVGTLVNVNGTPCIKADNVGLYLTGSGLPDFTENPITRCFCTFKIDWDNQPGDAYSKGIYNANINIESKWETENYLENLDSPFTGSDSLNSISKPYIIRILNTPIITFQTSVRASENPEYQLAKETLNEASRTVTLDFVYYAGANVNENKSDIRWHSYTLPVFPQDYTLILKFKSFAVPGFTHTAYSDQADNKKNAYLFSVSYKAETN